VIFCKTALPDLLRRDLAARSYRPSTITLSGITDAYQPVERRLRITRRCLEMLAECRHPVDIITKSHLVTRDLDLLSSLARLGAARVDISFTTLDPETARRMEPRAASPQRRLDAISACRDAGVPVGVLCSPIIPGLTDHELPRLLTAAADAGAQWAHIIPLRLPGAVKDVFIDWVHRNYPDRADKVLNRQRELRGGELNDARFGHRFRAQGPFYDHLHQVLTIFRQKNALADHGPRLSLEHFRKPEIQSGPSNQLQLFS
jgi:DNA repair photolyase